MSDSPTHRYLTAVNAPACDAADIARLDARFLTACAPWALETDVLADHLASFGSSTSSPTSDPLQELEESELGDLALALAAARGNAAAVGEVERTVIDAVPRSLARLRMDRAFIDEVKQELRHKLLVADGQRPARLLDYRGRGPLGAWARVVTVRLAYTMVREAEEPRNSEVDDGLANLAAAADAPELSVMREAVAAEFRPAFEEAARSLTAEERAVLRSSTVDGMTIDQLGTMYQVHRSTAARWLQHAKDSLLRALRGALAARLGEDQDACESMVRLVQSRIDLSLERVLSSETRES